VVIRQQLPLSTDTKIKVCLVTPTEEDVKAAAEREAKRAETEAQGVIHPSHQHPLSKLVEPNYKAWLCDVCQKQGRSIFRYRCKGCDFDVCEICWNKERDVAIGSGPRIKLDPTTNLLEWTAKVAPGGKVDIPFVYSITWPRDRQITIC